MFIDTHCHLSNKYYDDIEFIINENKQNNIEKMIISGCEKEDIDETLELINKYDFIYATIGYHPDQVEFIREEDINNLEVVIKSNKKIIGIGEIGLDYHYNKKLKNEQQLLFEKQLDLAEKLNMPVVIHSRDATEDTINILKKYKLSGIIHCFSGSFETAEKYIAMGYKLGIGGVVTFKNSKLPEVISKISLENIVLETDSPFLTPEPYRGTENSSKYIPLIAKKIAEIKKVSLEEISNNTNQNCNDLFDLKH